MSTYSSELTLLDYLEGKVSPEEKEKIDAVSVSAGTTGGAGSD